MEITVDFTGKPSPSVIVVADSKNSAKLFGMTPIIQILSIIALHVQQESTQRQNSISGIVMQVLVLTVEWERMVPE
jgi:hypothetical protein